MIKKAIRAAAIVIMLIPTVAKAQSVVFLPIVYSQTGIVTVHCYNDYNNNYEWDGHIEDYNPSHAPILRRETRISVTHLGLPDQPEVTFDNVTLGNFRLYGFNQDQLPILIVCQWQDVNRITGAVSQSWIGDTITINVVDGIETEVYVPMHSN